MGTWPLCAASCVGAGVSTGDPLTPAVRTPWHGLAFPCSSVWPPWLVAAWPRLGTRRHWMECLLHRRDDSGLVPCLGDSSQSPGWRSPKMLGQTVLSPVLLAGVIGRCQSRGVQVGKPAPLTPYWERGPCRSVGFWGIFLSTAACSHCTSLGCASRIWARVSPLGHDLSMKQNLRQNPQIKLLLRLFLSLPGLSLRQEQCQPHMGQLGSIHRQ